MIDFEKERDLLLHNEYTSGFNKDEVDSYVKSTLPKRFATSLYESNAGRPLIQPRGGFATYAETYELYENLAEAGADILPLTIDSHTRQNNHIKAGELLRISEENNTNLLNGYPLVNHGYKVTRKLTEAFDIPISLRHGTPDPRLLVEIAIASGIYEIEGGPITYVLPYSKNYPLDQAFLHWNYVEKLCARYSRLNRDIIRESFGPLTATLVPPAITIVVEVLELLLSAIEGITSFSVAFSQTGSIIQDVAISKILPKMTARYLNMLSLNEVKTYLVYHHWMGAFPKDKYLSDTLINLGSIISLLINADKVVIKTRDESFGIPEISSNVQAIKQIKYLYEIFQPISVGNELIDEEIELIEKEADAILESVLAFPGDTLWRKIYNAIKSGIIDVPFSPHIANKGALISVRDQMGAIRIHDKGSVPIPAKAEKIEKEKAAAGRKHEKIVPDIMEGIYFMSGNKRSG